MPGFGAISEFLDSLNVIPNGTDAEMYIQSENTELINEGIEPDSLLPPAMARVVISP